MSSEDVGRLFVGLSLFFGALTYVSTVLRFTWQPWIVLATFAGLVVPVSLGGALALGLIVGPWPAAVAAAAIALSYYLIQGRSQPAASQTGSTLTVLTANLLIGAADPAALVSAVVEHQVDLLLAQEVTPEAEQSLLAGGIGEQLAHSFVQARPGGGGTAIFSRFPLTEQTAHDGFWFAILSARLQLDTGTPFVCAAHLSPPWPYPSALWARELPSLHAILEGQPRLGGVSDAVILGADLNATFDHPQFRELLRGQLRDAAAQVGRRRLRTWPADRLRPVFGIDHILLRSATARTVQTIPLPGSDHLGVLATVQLPEG